MKIWESYYRKNLVLNPGHINQNQPCDRINRQMHRKYFRCSFFPWAFNRWFQALMFALNQNKLNQFHLMSPHDEVWTFEFEKKVYCLDFLEVHVMAYPILKDWKQQSRFIYKNVGKFLFIKFDTKMMDIRKGTPKQIINWTHKKNWNNQRPVECLTCGLALSDYVLVRYTSK